MRLTFLIATLLFLAAPQQQAQQRAAAQQASFADQMKAADAKCPHQEVVGHLVERDSCVSENEKLVWERNDPVTLADFENYWKDVKVFDAAIDSGQITLDWRVQAITQRKAKFYSDAQQHRAQYAQTEAQRSFSVSPANQSTKEEANQSTKEESDSANIGGVLSQILIGVAGIHNSTAGLNAEAAYMRGQAEASGVNACCKVCTIGKACGNTCITVTDTCHVPPGCACNQ